MQLVEVLEQGCFSGPWKILGAHGFSEAQHRHETSDAHLKEKIPHLFFHQVQIYLFIRNYFSLLFV